MGQIHAWTAENGLEVGDRLPPKRELGTKLGVSRATVSQALVAMEVVGTVSVARFATLAATRPTESDLAVIDDALAGVEREVSVGGRRVEGDEPVPFRGDGGQPLQVPRQAHSREQQPDQDTRISSRCGD
jgi:GntR family transcriptional repressor for pyruvate dehydrogenase complex